MNIGKKLVYDFWEKASCGEDLYLKGKSRKHYLKQAEIRYKLEPYIIDFAEFYRYKSKKVLEIGVGLGADHQKFAESGAVLCGIDLTERAIQHTCKRFQILGLTSNLQVDDVENLPFYDESFDLVYSWGVIHVTPDMPRAVEEIYRVLKRGCEAKVMIYHKYSFVGYMLWIKYALLRGKPRMSLKEIYNKYLESFGTKAYSIQEAKKLFSKFRKVDIKTVLTHGDLLTSAAGQRHRGLMLSVARLIWPRYIIRTFFPSHGLFMLIRAAK